MAVTPDKRQAAVEALTHLFISKGMDPDLAAKGSAYLVDQAIAQHGG
ncbi:MAG: hypothetical protein ACRDOK_02685 [Streptosporangiaceae bacterium]